MDEPDPRACRASVTGTEPTTQELIVSSTWSDRVVATVRRGAPTAIAIGLLAAIAVRRYIGIANADALLPALMSTQQWTLFYWGQDRLANLVALLAVPVRDPVWNFEIQSLLIASCFFGVGATFVSYHAWARGKRARPWEHAVATLVTGVFVMLPMHTVAGYRFAIEQLYFVSVLVWLGAVWAWQRRRFVLGAALLQVAALVNPSLLAASPLAWLLDDDREGRNRRSACFVLAALGAFAVSSVAERLFATGPDVDHPYDEFRLDHLATGTRAVAGNIAGSVRDHLAVGVVIGAVALVAVSTRHLVPRRAAIYGLLPVFSALWFLAFSMNGWVIVNLHEFRYFYPLYVTFMLFVAGAATEIVLATRHWRPSFQRSRSRGRLIAVTESVSVVVAATIALVTVHRTEVDALAATGAHVDAAEEFGARLVAGNYWNTWPTVVAGRSDGLPLLGVTYRSDPITDEIQAVLDAAARGDGSETVVCSGVDAAGCIALVNERSAQPWTIDGQLQEWPLVLRIVPSEEG